MRARLSLLLAIACFAVTSGCSLLFSGEPDLRDDRTAIVPGRETTDLNPAEARRAALIEAARITVDHGYQYFVVLRRAVWTPSGSVRAGNDSAIRPGDDVTIKVFHNGEISPGTRDVFDAQRLLTNGVSQAQGAAPVYFPQPATSPAPQQGTSRPPPHCTAYGCSW
jgi:hypothetical protein